MVKKTLLSLAVATALASMAGCNVSSTDKYDNKITKESPATQKMPIAKALHPIFAPENAQLPVATDFVFAINSLLEEGEPGKDGTADTKDTTPPVTTALNKLAGFSTIAPIYINMSEAPVSASVIAGQTVFLIKLLNAEHDPAIDPLDLASIAEHSPIVTGADGKPTPNPVDVVATSTMIGTGAYSADVVDLDGQPAIRILLNKPLEPKTKYIVVLTDDIANASGKASGSPTYQLVSGEAGLPSAALSGVRTLVKNWENIAGGFLAQATAALPTPKTKENIVLSYAFTTDGSQSGLEAYAAPSLFVKDNLTVEQAEAMTDAAAAPLTDVVARSIAVATGGGDKTDPSQLVSIDDATIDAVKANPAYNVQLFKAIAEADLTETAGSSLTNAANAPKARTVSVVPPAAVDAVILDKFGPTNGANGASPATLLNMLQPGSSTDTTTRYIQGTIALPDFLGAVTKTDTSKLTTDPMNNAAVVTAAQHADTNWAANTTVGAMLESALKKPAGTLPPKDVNGSTNVTYRFPFPQTIGENNAPFLLTLPSATCAAPFETAIFVHGITSNRAGSALYAAQLAGQCIATISIDLPLHGVAPADGALSMLSLDTENAEATGSPWAGVAAAGGASISERHGNITQNDNSIRLAMDYSVIAEAKVIADATEREEKFAEGGSSGSAFINLQNFGRTHDNLRQAVTDLLNLNASIETIGKAVNTADTSVSLLNKDKVFVVGHSLGGIVASAFVSVNNSASVQAAVGVAPTNPTGVLPKIKGLIIANSGAHLTKLLENSPGFAPTIVGGLAKGGVNQGTENFEKFLYVFQSVIDGMDPANTASKLNGTPVKMFTVVGDGSITPPDTTVPVYDYFADEGSNPFAPMVVPSCMATPKAIECKDKIALPNAGVPTAKAPLAGTAGLKFVNPSLGSENTDITDATHSSFANGKPEAAFGQMVSESITFIKTTN